MIGRGFGEVVFGELHQNAGNIVVNKIKRGIT
jgi:hypothetical protein